MAKQVYKDSNIIKKLGEKKAPETELTISGAFCR